MQQMKHFIFILFILFGCLNTNKAQVMVSCSDLDGTKWRVVEDYTDEWGIHYTGSPEGEFYEFTTETKILHYEDGTYSTYQYYITNSTSKPKKFDFNKVGSKGKGQYIVQYNSKMNTIKTYYIQTFDKKSKKMTLIHVPNGCHKAMLTNYLLIGETSPSKPKSTYDTPLDPIVSKEYDVLERDTSTGTTSTSGKTSTSGNSSTGKSTSTGGGATTNTKTNTYIGSQEQLKPLK